MLKTMLFTVALLAPTAFADSFTISNGGFRQGSAGTIVGWDFTVISTAIEIGPNGMGRVSTPSNFSVIPWLLITNMEFILDTGVFPVGVFTPLLTIYSTPVGPDTGHGEENPWTRPFDLALLSGLASYDINAFQSPGDLATGVIQLTYDVYWRSPNDPVFDPIIDTAAVGLTLSAPVSVLVTNPPAEVPEPASAHLALLGMSLCVAASLWRRRRGR